MEENNNNMIGQRISERRKALNLSEKQLAEKAGIQTSSITHFERGRSNPSAKALIKLSKALDCSVDFILFGPETQAQKAKTETNSIRNLKEIVNLLQESISSISEEDSQLLELFSQLPADEKLYWTNMIQARINILASCQSDKNSN